MRIELTTPVGESRLKAEVAGKKLMRQKHADVGDFLSYLLHPEKDLARVVLVFVSQKFRSRLGYGIHPIT